MARDSRWLIVVAIIVAVITTTSIMNNQKHADIITRVEDAINIEEDDLKIDWSHYQTTNIRLTSSIEITRSGTYHLTGNLYDGSINIKLAEDGVARLVLDNISIYNSKGPAITCYSGENLVIELVGDNTIADSSSYDAKYDEDIKGAIYSKIDLYFTGDGTLNLTGNHEDGIISKDDLTFRSGTYDITVQNEAIRGRDSVHVTDGNFTIKSTSHAIESTNDVDAGRGFIYIENGNFNLISGEKGFKSAQTVLIHDGNFLFETTDDTIHSDGYIGITGGTISINSGDDAIHANRELEVSGGTITVAKSYEGLEAQKITIKDGNISIIASDDGINAGGGADSSSSIRPNQSPFNTDENCILTIDGGELYINSSGDGIDSNGWLYINGGNVVVDGPTDNGNGALDAGMGIVMNGGNAIAIGASGMAGNLGQTSSVNNLNIFLNHIYPADTKIEIKDQSDNIVLSHISAKSFDHIAAGSSTFTLGSNYYLYIDDELYANLTISGITTTIGNNRNAINPNLDNRSTYHSGSYAE